jgi:hypothetical protein
VAPQRTEAGPDERFAVALGEDGECAAVDPVTADQGDSAMTVLDQMTCGIASDGLNIGSYPRKSPGGNTSMS